MLQEAKEFIKTREKMNLLMVTVNILVFIYMSVFGNIGDFGYMYDHGAMIGKWVVRDQDYYRLVTSMFLHFSFEHVAYNMLMLIIAGDILEKRVGKIRYLLIYFGGGIIGNVFSMVREMQADHIILSAGASGAIFAVIGALAWLMISNRRTIRREFISRVSIVTVLMLVEGFQSEHVDGTAHLGGFAGGLLIAFVLNLLFMLSRSDK